MLPNYENPMKLCLCCKVGFEKNDWQCPKCGNNPSKINGFASFFLNQSSFREEYNVEHYANLINLEENNFWFCARNALIIWAINKYFKEAKNFFEVGCGTGFVLAGLNRALPHLKLTGSEIYIEGLKFASKRVALAELLHADAREIPFLEEFDLVGIFDVLEHISDDQSVLEQLYRTVSPGGGVIITVPQHQFLWSYQDVAASHVRRYSSSELEKKVRATGFKIIKITSFVSLLLPLMMLMRFSVRGPQVDYDPQGELKINSKLNTILNLIMDFEVGLIRAGASFSFGGSLLLIAKKP